MRGIHLAVAALLGLSASACRPAGPDHPLVRAYLAAEVVAPSWNPAIRPREPMWRHEVRLAGGTAVVLEGACCVGGRFTARYADEPSPRIMASGGDYVYPQELRLDAAGGRAFARAGGAEAGLRRVTVLFEYDLERREPVARVEVDAGVLPEARRPEGP